jgi:general secretion pathway protein G
MGRHIGGFTLIELMIVMTVLAILAVIVVPQIMSASGEARESALRTDLTMLRRQIDIYRLQHGQRGPHLDENGQLDTAGFIARLAGRTDSDGKLNANGVCGPYVTEWPTNPFGSEAVAGDVAFAKPSPPLRNGKTGWYYSTITCIISPNSATGAEDLDPPGLKAVAADAIELGPVRRTVRP